MQRQSPSSTLQGVPLLMASVRHLWAHSGTASRSVPVGRAFWAAARLARPARARREVFIVEVLTC
jgi:hypothetical protein